MKMTSTQFKAFQAVIEWQKETSKIVDKFDNGKPVPNYEHWRAMIAGTMISMLPLTGDQLEQIDEIINY